MKVGDLVKYRDRISSDPTPEVAGEAACWGDVGIVIDIFETQWQEPGLYEPSIIFINTEGEKMVCRQAEVEVINV